MSERVLGREPVQILEIITPKCVNVHGSAPCTATQTGSRKCFNTRATCNDTANYQARPLSHLTPDLVLEQDDTAAQTENGSDAYLVEIDMRFGPSPDGVVFEIGSASTAGLYVGFTSGNLVIRCGASGVADGDGVAKISVDPTAYIGKEFTLIVVATRDAGVNQTIEAYLFDPVEFTLTRIGADTSVDDSAAAIFDSGNYGVGTSSGDIPTGEDADDYNGAITGVRFYTDQTATLDLTPDAYRQRYLFDDGRKARPGDEGLYILPMLQSVQAVGTRLNVTNADERYEALGRRAYITANFADAPHSDYPFDPYLVDRGYDPLKLSTFWAKWLQRNKFGKTRAIVRLYHGYDGDALADMVQQTYVLDSLSWSRESATLRCRDYLSLTEFRRAQVPKPTGGKLNSSITAGDTSFDLAGDRRAEYPAAGGTLRINDELMTYTGVAYNTGPDTTTISGLTRGTDGSTATGHDGDDTVQLCRRYTNARIDDVLEELLVVDSRIPAQFVDLAQFTALADTDLDDYSLTTLISEPTGVDQLVGELSEQCAFYIWWDEREQIVTMKAIVPLTGVDVTFTQEGHIIADTFELTERPKERLTTISAYYNPRNFAGDLSKPVNYNNQLVVSNSTASGPDQYGRLPQIREVFSRWLTTEAQVNQTLSRFSIRYADVPFYASFMVDAKDREYWVGNFCRISHDYLVNARGERDSSRRWLIIEAEEVEPGHAQRITCVDVTLDGILFTIAADGFGTYTPELFAEGVAFITQNDGTNLDGSPGATIG